MSSGVSEEFVELELPEPASNGSARAASPWHAAGTSTVGSELLPELVYPVLEGRLLSQTATARAGRRLRERLSSAPDRVESLLDIRLRSLPRRRLRSGPRVLASCSPKGGTGKTSLALLIAQLISMIVRWPALVIDADLTGGTARDHIPTEGRASASFLDALSAIRSGDVRGPMDLVPFVSVIPGCAHLLSAPQDPASLDAIDTADMRELVEAVRVLYPVTIVDCAPGVGARDPVQKAIHHAATDLLAVLLPRRVDHEQAKRMLKYLGEQCPGVPLTVVLNRLPHRPDEGARCARQQVSVGPQLAAQIELPADDALQRQLDAAVLDVDGLAQGTRIGLKQLVVSLAEAWV